MVNENDSKARVNLCLPKTWSCPCLPRPLCISFTKGLGEAQGLILLQTCRKSQLAFSFHPSALLTSLGGAPLWVHLGLGPMSQPSEGQRAVSHAGSWEPPPFMHALQHEHHWFHRHASRPSARARGPSLLCLHNGLSVPRKLAQKRKETMSSTRQEMTVMVSSMDKSYAEQGTSCDEAFSFMDTHNLNGRCEWAPFPLPAALGPGG